MSSAGGFYNTCYAVVYDNGLDSNYLNNSNAQLTIAPLWVQTTSLYFENFELEPFFDKLEIYDGAGIGSPLIGSYSGTSLQGQTITASTNAITLRLLSDDIYTTSGFKAWVSCVMNISEYEDATWFYQHGNAIYMQEHNDIVELILYDITGKIICTKKCDEINLLEIPILNTGIYLIKYTNANNVTKTKKLWLAF